ncbi:MAG: ATP-dependent RNA helicase [Treponema sp.]|nr:ATP-dependent RNA helicase [Treponema sp.]
MNYLELPVYKNHKKILTSLENNQAVVVESPTGSGKTTQLPVILYEAGYSRNGIIGVTQPRRIAAVSVSEFIARQMGTSIPGLVGYKMRFEDKTNSRTKIKIMTDGILLQEMKLDPWLSKYSFLVVDEAHERSLNIDFVLGLLKRVMESRRDFKVIISSATINAEVFSEYFGECPIVKIEAQRFPVTLIYDSPSVAENRESYYSRRKFGNNSQDSIADAIIDKIEDIILRFKDEDGEGDILVFLSGEKMIKDCMHRLAFSPVGSLLHILPLYGRLSKEEQERVFEKTPEGKTKVILSTNIAETSVTIDGISTVIDSGLSKLNWYNSSTFTSSLIETAVSKASANQRKGRAGRTCEGTCYRLYSRRDFENRPLYTTEEIFRTDLSEVILRMADLGITNFEEFEFISMPEKEGFIGGIETLHLLNALEPDRSLSNIGKLMAEFPLAPRQSRIIVEAILHYPQVIGETIIAAAFLSTQGPYILPLGEESDARKAHQRFRDDNGDFVSYLTLFKAYSDAKSKAKFCESNYLDEKAMAEIANVIEQLEEILCNMKIPVLRNGKISDYLTCIGRGMIQFVCAREGLGRKSSYRTLTADKIIIHPGSVMFRMDPQFIVAGEIVRTSRMYAMSVSPLTLQILKELGIRKEDLGYTEKTQPLMKFRDTKGGRNESKKHPAAIAEGEGRRKLKKPMDFANNIKIAGEIFEIKVIKGKKTAMLPWEKLSQIRDIVPSHTVYKGLKGCVTYNNTFTFLAGEKLELILSLLPALDPENALERKWPGKKIFNINTDLAELLEYMDSLVKPAQWKKKSKELGFLSLFTDGEGNYWIRCSRGFHTSLNESIASLDVLINETGDDVDIGKKHIVNQSYRRLSDLIRNF